jgi:thiol:disulfide interchange protein
MLFLLVFVCVTATTSAQQYPQMGPDIYNTEANAAPTIGLALKMAKQQNKHVLLDFGANWCVWCHRLHEVFTQNALVRSELKKNYITVMIDVNRRNGPARNTEVDAHYGYPSKLGLPALVVLDQSGRVLVKQETGALEHGSRHDPQKIIAFLRKWAPDA